MNLRRPLSHVGELSSKVGRVVVPRARIASALGWTLVAVAAAAGTIGFALGWAELVALALGATAILLVAVPFVIVRPVYDVRIELAAHRVRVGERAVGRLVVTGAGRRTSPATRVELPVGVARAEFRMPRLAPGIEHDELFSVPTHRRAVLTLGPVTSVRSDPLGALRREVAWTEPELLYVHPRVIALDSETTGILRDLEGLPTSDLADDDMSFHALREYASGDDLRHVHWMSTARTQRLMIRQFEQTRRSHLLLVLSSDLDDYANDDEFELAVSTVGSIGLAALRGGKDMTVITHDGTLASRGARGFLDALSGLEARSRAAGLTAPARAIAAAAPGASVVVFVTGGAGPLADLRAASLRAPITARTVAVRAAGSEPAARRAIGDLAFVDVPELEALPQAMRAVSE
ncbi:DUF58 domain-containing protein [Microbacterium trichothecenolyticum]|uniref:Uncharacterized protein (DUF58 family) n=1 Tax=Microbacterium trichothecenolyticum TaxID=69370 RepID=A0ABU0TYW9_MICTR|nr:DUF58 domain-containing protein [Microbacterium trichothecenolyticum]MDQ1124710.1 uncharacterized protein (DUF58 family) [Microbacterium trichothecenolyticum]